MQRRWRNDQTGGAMVTRIPDSQSEICEIASIHFQDLCNVEESGEAADTMTTLMSRFATVDAVLRREVVVVQDLRGCDYDVGWLITNVAVTADGSTIAKMICTRKLINFKNLTVTSTLIEKP
jgi:hypothetical protein